MQPFQCDLQPQVQETNRTTHSGTTTRCSTQRRNPFCVRNDPSCNRRTHEVPFIAGCKHFTRKNTRFRAPASSPKQSPSNIHAAIAIRFAASRSTPANLYTHGNTRLQQSYSHYTGVLLCDVKSHTTVSHRPSLSVLLCDVKSRTTVSHRPSLSVLVCDVKSHTTVSRHPSLNVFLCNVKSHTTVSHHPSLNVFLCNVKSHATLH